MLEQSQPGKLFLAWDEQALCVMQANLKHYANMKHLPPGEYLSNAPVDKVCPPSL